jgi:hypothetical protein
MLDHFATDWQLLVVDFSVTDRSPDSIRLYGLLLYRKNRIGKHDTKDSSIRELPDREMLHFSMSQSYFSCGPTSHRSSETASL